MANSPSLCRYPVAALLAAFAVESLSCNSADGVVEPTVDMAAFDSAHAGTDDLAPPLDLAILSDGCAEGRWEMAADHLTVKDRQSGLTWQVAGGPQPYYTRDEAVAYCKSLPLSGGGWSVPTVDQLMTVYTAAPEPSDCHMAACAFGASSLAVCGSFWSSSTNDDFPPGSHGWIMNFGMASGRPSSDFLYGQYRARCVR